MGSMIPLFGLNSTVNVQRRTSTLSSGILVDGTPTVVYNSVRCRITLVDYSDDSQQQHFHGLSGKQLWAVTMEPKSDIQLFDQIVVGSSSKTSAPVGTYDIVDVRPKRDHLGTLHHWELRMELR